MWLGGKAIRNDCVTKYYSSAQWKGLEVLEELSELDDGGDGGDGEEW